MQELHLSLDSREGIQFSLGLLSNEMARKIPEKNTACEVVPLAGLCKWIASISTGWDRCQTPLRCTLCLGTVTHDPSLESC